MAQRSPADPSPGQGGALNQFWRDAIPEGRMGDPLSRRKCHPGPAPEPPGGAAPWLQAARTHSPLISPRKDVCLLQEKGPRGSNYPVILGRELALASEKKMQAARLSMNPTGATGRSKHSRQEARCRHLGKPTAPEQPKMRPRGRRAEVKQHTEGAGTPGQTLPRPSSESTGRAPQRRSRGYQRGTT